MPRKAPPPVMPDKLERWPIERLVPYEKNARTHSADQVAQIAASIQEFGFTNPILVASDDGILAGHGRLAAAKDLGLREVPVVVLDHLTPTQRRAYVLADNKLALNAGWDEEMLQQEIAALSLVDFDLSLMGWSDDELAGLLDPEGIDDDAGHEGEEGKYTDKVDVPPYEITGPKPELEDIYDLSKVEELLQQIEQSSLPDKEKHFLRAAAYRHAVFNYQHCAEYYAHSSADVQELMENSALVIVDFDKAIQNGWVKLNEQLKEIYRKEKGIDL
jgi:hypothetical protein